MVITTQVLGTLQRESFAFTPVSGTRYYVPKGRYEILIAREGGKIGAIGHTASNGNTFSSATSAYYEGFDGGEIEWIEFTGPIWRVLMSPVVNAFKTIPPTTPI